MRKPSKVRFVVVILLAVGLAYWAFRSPSGPKQTLRTATVEQGSIDALVTAQGKLEPKAYVEVGLQVSGQIKKLYVDVSDQVKKGQLLADIDARTYESRVAADLSQIKSLKAQREEQAAALELAQRQYARNAQMYRKKAISKDTMDQAESALKAAAAKLNSIAAQIEQENSQLSADRTNLSYTKIYAPMAGVVAAMPVRLGQTLNAVQSAPTLMEIDNLDVMTVRAQVAEADIPRITLGMPVYFTTLGDTEHRWKGSVRLIQPSPEVINDVVLYNVLIDAENPEHKLLNGMSTQVFFELGSAQDVPTLPMDALGKRMPAQDTDTGKAYQVKLQGEDTPHTVLVGITDRSRAQILSGVKLGDVAVLPARQKPQTAGVGSKGGMPPGMGGPKL